jgi:peptide/nickel transport system ATP-binding protein
MSATSLNNPFARLKTENLILEVKNLKTFFFLKEGILKAVDDVSFSLLKNNVFSLVGESGSGKTILSLSLIKLLPERAKIIDGEVLYNGKNLIKMKEREMSKIRGRRIAMIFQEPMTALNPVFTVGEQIMETIKYHYRLSRREAFSEMLNLLNKVKFPEPEKRYKTYPHQLSGGMRQRALIAIALSARPEILIADEPTTALDVTIEREIIDLLLNEFDLSLIFISHDMSLVSRISDYTGVMYAGKLVEIGKTDNIINNPKHPYTIALLDSLPIFWKEKKGKIKTIPGSVPNLLNLPSGCAFHPRCTKKEKICTFEEPLVKEVNGQLVKCWLY